MNNLKNIQYLIKFVSKYEYAEDLIKGKLFMRPARYFHHLERGQGDNMEASVASGLGLYKNMDFPLYCIYANYNVYNNKIVIPNKLITDFKCENGYAVIIKFSDFSEALSRCDTKGYDAVGGLVRYTSKPFVNIDYFLNDKDCTNLFYKDPYFSYQQEFRFVIYKKLDNNIEYVIFNIPNMTNCAKLITVKDMEIIGENRVINLNIINDSHI